MWPLSFLIWPYFSVTACKKHPIRPFLCSPSSFTLQLCEPRESACMTKQLWKWISPEIAICRSCERPRFNKGKTPTESLRRNFIALRMCVSCVSSLQQGDTRTECFFVCVFLFQLRLRTLLVWKFSSDLKTWHRLVEEQLFHKCTSCILQLLMFLVKKHQLPRVFLTKICSHTECSQAKCISMIIPQQNNIPTCPFILLTRIHKVHTLVNFILCFHLLQLLYLTNRNVSEKGLLHFEFLSWLKDTLNFLLFFFLSLKTFLCASKTFFVKKSTNHFVCLMFWRWIC